MKNFPFNTARLVQSVIGKQAFQIERWEGKTLLSNGYHKDTYSDPEVMDWIFATTHHFQF